MVPVDEATTTANASGESASAHRPGVAVVDPTAPLNAVKVDLALDDSDGFVGLYAGCC